MRTRTSSSFPGRRGNVGATLAVLLSVSAMVVEAPLPSAAADGEIASAPSSDLPDFAATVDDLAVIKQRLVAPLLEPVSARTAKVLADTLQDDGSWPNVDYEHRDRSGWSTPRHLTNVTILARAYRSPKSALHDTASVRDAALASLDYWLAHDFRNPNWWWNEIGVPRTMLPIVLLMHDDLSDDQRQSCLGILRRAKIGMTGQNLVWVTHITAGRGIVQHDAELVAKAYRRIADEIHISTGEGIQPDYSFHQHGPCLYSHGYGAAFVVDCSRIANEVAGTRFAMSPKKIAVLSSLILDGSQWMTRGGATDFGAEGREITRSGQDASYLRSAVANMLNLPTGREQEFRELAARLSGGQAPPPLIGNRHFWRSDIMTHHRPQFMSSARMVSRRIANTDQPCNGEGLKSHHLADGCNVILRTGREYDEIFPVWDWQKIPGTTVEQTEKLSGSPRRTGATDFVGGVSDGMYGAAAFDLVRGPLAARKSWFFFDDQVVCLGAGIACQSTSPVITTLNQCNRTGDVVVSADAGSQTLQPGEHLLTQADAAPATWVWHDQVGYFSLCSSTIHIRNDAQRGRWSEINQRYSRDEIQRDVFTAWIEHGRSPVDASYAYMVAPGIDVTSMDDCAKNLPIQILRNGRNLQAVWHTSLRMGGFAFYKAGRCVVGPELTLAVNSSCLMLVCTLPDGLSVTVSDPTAKLAAVQVEIGDGARRSQAEGKDTVQLTFDLPTGMNAGKSVTRSVPR
jgi:chondroitin AC lyase